MPVIGQDLDPDEIIDHIPFNHPERFRGRWRCLCGEYFLDWTYARAHLHGLTAWDWLCHQ